MFFEGGGVLERVQAADDADAVGQAHEGQRGGHIGADAGAGLELGHIQRQRVRGGLTDDALGVVGDGQRVGAVFGGAGEGLGHAADGAGDGDADDQRLGIGAEGLGVHMAGQLGAFGGHALDAGQGLERLFGGHAGQVGVAAAGDVDPFDAQQLFHRDAVDEFLQGHAGEDLFAELGGVAGLASHGAV